MNENLLTGINKANYRGLDCELYQDLPICKTPTDVQKMQPTEFGKHSICNATHEAINAYLKEKFDMDIYDFMCAYTERHVSEPFALPIVAPLITCVMRKERDAKKLQSEMCEHQATVLRVPGGTTLNLHDNSMYVFTLIEAGFPVGPQGFFPGYYYSKQDYRFRIKSSAQFDITVIYERR